MVTREQIHQLVGAIPDSGLADAERALAPLVDPVLLALLTAPEDDEPETDEERAAVAEAHEAIARGDVVPHEQIKREFGREIG